MGFLRGNLPPLVLTGRNNTWQKVNTWTESHCCRKVALAPLARGSKSRGPSLFCNVQLFYCLSSWMLRGEGSGVRGTGKITTSYTDIAECQHWLEAYHPGQQDLWRHGCHRLALFEQPVQRFNERERFFDHSAKVTYCFNQVFQKG